MPRVPLDHLPRRPQDERRGDDDPRRRRRGFDVRIAQRGERDDVDDARMRDGGAREEHLGVVSHPGHVVMRDRFRRGREEERAEFAARPGERFAERGRRRAENLPRANFPSMRERSAAVRLLAQIRVAAAHGGEADSQDRLRGSSRVPRVPLLRRLRYLDRDVLIDPLLYVIVFLRVFEIRARSPPFRRALPRQRVRERQHRDSRRDVRRRVVEPPRQCRGVVLRGGGGVASASRPRSPSRRHRGAFHQGETVIAREREREELLRVRAREPRRTQQTRAQRVRDDARHATPAALVRDRGRSTHEPQDRADVLRARVRGRLVREVQIVAFEEPRVKNRGDGGGPRRRVLPKLRRLHRRVRRAHDARAERRGLARVPIRRVHEQVELVPEPRARRRRGFAPRRANRAHRRRRGRLRRAAVPQQRADDAQRRERVRRAGALEVHDRHRERVRDRDVEKLRNREQRVRRRPRARDGARHRATQRVRVRLRALRVRIDERVGGALDQPLHVIGERDRDALQRAVHELRRLRVRDVVDDAGAEHRVETPRGRRERLERGLESRDDVHAVVHVHRVFVVLYLPPRQPPRGDGRAVDHQAPVDRVW
eukprot:30825-Pelagococcus_subviridis.AAC.6